jgi:hypothetical protein
LTIDAVINVGLGALLLVFPRPVITFLGLPSPVVTFYPSILGAVLVGIGIALIVERRDSGHPTAGLGLLGAVTINACGGVALASWLLSGRLALPVRGAVCLWVLVALLVGLSSVELGAQLGRRLGGQAG